MRKLSYRNKHILMETIYKDRSIPVRLGLDLNHLLLILREAISLFSTETELQNAARLKSEQLAALYEQDEQITEEDLDQICTILETFVSSPRDELPPSLVAYVHTYVGLIRQDQRRYTCAVTSFLKALWVRTAAHDPAEQIAVATHRLGVAYGLAGELNQAASLLSKALQHYEDAQVPGDHHFIRLAKKSLGNYHLRQGDAVEEKQHHQTIRGVFKALSQNSLEVGV